MWIKVCRADEAMAGSQHRLMLCPISFWAPRRKSGQRPSKRKKIYRKEGVLWIMSLMSMKNRVRKWRREVPKGGPIQLRDIVARRTRKRFRDVRRDCGVIRNKIVSVGNFVLSTPIGVTFPYRLYELNFFFALDIFSSKLHTLDKETTKFTSC